MNTDTPRLVILAYARIQFVPLIAVLQSALARRLRTGFWLSPEWRWWGGGSLCALCSLWQKCFFRV